MRTKSHLRLFFSVSLVWFVFWLIGLPDYYQQYSFRFMLIFDIALIPILIAITYYLLKNKKHNIVKTSLWLAFYFTFPFLVYDVVYCVFYLDEGVTFISTYWYLTVFYILPWLICVPMGILLNSRLQNHLTNSSSGIAKQDAAP